VGRFALLLVAGGAAAIFAAGATADAVYHTATIPLQPVAGAPGGGVVINIHANGPIVYAHELYLLKGARPGSYQVTLHIDPAHLDCSAPALNLPTATVVTNSVGNGEADATFTPDQADGLRGHTVSAFWTATGPASYKTGCNVITLD
jgi:hypothetical protein